MKTGWIELREVQIAAHAIEAVWARWVGDRADGCTHVVVVRTKSGKEYEDEPMDSETAQEVIGCICERIEELSEWQSE